MKLLHKYELNIQGKRITDVTIVSEWNGLIELDAGVNKGKIIVRRKGWNNGKEWQKEANAFMEQELDIISADERIGLPKMEIIFTKPEDSD
jgi:hypothetical protein